jgi:short-subunit dehydrogenase
LFFLCILFFGLSRIDQPMSRLAGKVVVITGASSGIGAAAAELIARRGADVVLVARRADALEEVAARIGKKAHAIPADMTSRADVQRVVREAIATCGHVDVWINNVGQGITRAPSQLSDQDIDDIMRVNVKSALYGMQEILPHFKGRGTGHVINISSMLGRMPMAVFRSAYNGAKHFLNALTANFRAEVQETHPGIQFTLVSPGVVRTEFGRNAMHGGPDSRTLPQSQSAEEVAEVIADVIESRRPDVYTRKGASEWVAKAYAAIGEDP